MRRRRCRGDGERTEELVVGGAASGGLIEAWPGNRAGMIIVGIVCLLLGLLLGAPILWTIGIILVVIGAILWLLGSTGRAIGGRRHYW